MNNFQLNQTVIKFARSLRQEGLKINQSHSLKAMEVLQAINLLDKQDFYLALKSVFCLRLEDYRPFDRIFRSYWSEKVPYAGSEYDSSPEDKHQENKEDQQADVEEMALDFSGSVNSNGQKDEETLLQKDGSEELEQVGRLSTYSSDEQLIWKQFESINRLDPSNFRTEWSELLTLLLQVLRKDSAFKGNRELEIKKTIRKNMSHGASELLQMYKRGKSKTDKQILFTLVDISGSMEIYLKLYLPIFYLLHRYTGRAETYFFNTNINQVSKYFKHPYEQTLNLLNAKMHSLSNGTNLGQVLREFSKTQSTKLSSQLTTLVIFSDGWDRGDMEQFEYQLKKIRSQVYQIIWINPLLGTQGYYPETHALKTAAPYVSRMISLQEMKSLQKNKEMIWRVK